MRDVPYIRQVVDGACGAAALEMACRHLQPDLTYSQWGVFQKHRTTGAGGAPQINTDALVTAARELGFRAGWGRVSTTAGEMLEQVRYFTESVQIPLIASQWRKESQQNLGHFRVIVDAQADAMTLHDPWTGPSERWKVTKVMKFWRPNQIITGGVVIWVADRDLEDVLLPDQPNDWHRP